MRAHIILRLQSWRRSATTSDASGPLKLPLSCRPLVLSSPASSVADLAGPACCEARTSLSATVYSMCISLSSHLCVLSDVVLSASPWSGPGRASSQLGRARATTRRDRIGAHVRRQEKRAVAQPVAAMSDQYHSSSQLAAASRLADISTSWRRRVVNSSSRHSQLTTSHSQHSLARPPMSAC